MYIETFIPKTTINPVHCFVHFEYDCKMSYSYLSQCRSVGQRWTYNPIWNEILNFYRFEPIC